MWKRETSFKATAGILAKDYSGLVRVGVWYDDKWLNSGCILKIEPKRFADGLGMGYKGKNVG